MACLWCAQATAGLAQGSYSVQRFKGLGEMMPAQLWDTTMDPARRTLRRITTYDMEGATRTLSQLMGSKVRYSRRDTNTVCAGRPVAVVLKLCARPAINCVHMQVGPRKELIQQHATRFSLSDLDV